MQAFAEQSSDVGMKPQEVLDDEKWRAVKNRDQLYDGRFVFAVHSTRVYCRPSCPARRPSSSRVSFYLGPIDAEKAGFRPCKRCRPREEKSIGARLVDDLCRYIDANLDKRITLAALSNRSGLSPFHLQRTFKNILGISPREYLEARRVARMKRSLTRGETVNDALFSAGFSSRSRVYKEESAFGVPPGTFRRGGEGLLIKYTIFDSPLGRLLVAGTHRGVCAVCLGASDEAVEASLAQDYFAATLRREDTELSGWAKGFKKYFGDRPTKIDLPLDVQATAFQWKVWNKIRAIPYGKTLSYTGIASSLGNPRAVRAVANACATNPVALVVPCHRVIGKDGKLHGYRWGLRRKQALLIHEKMSGSNNF